MANSSPVRMLVVLFFAFPSVEFDGGPGSGDVFGLGPGFSSPGVGATPDEFADMISGDIVHLNL
jgi:hypothetical protein